MKLHIPDFENTRILVVGDIMLDRYWHGDTSRISPEAPVPVVHVRQTEERLGGAGNVALNLATLGCKVSFLGICGDDAAADILEQRLQAAGIDAQLLRLSSTTTPVKLRVISLHQQLIRLDFEESLTKIEKDSWLTAFEKSLQNLDAVVFSDYGKGTLQYAADMITAARKANIPVLVDPKSKDFSIYHGATIITPNRKEFEAVVGHCTDEKMLVEKGVALLRQHDIKALLITRGEQGMTLLRDGEPELHLPARAREVYDVTGAGDTVISVMSAAVAAKADLGMSAALANVAASIVVGKLGTATVSLPELRRNIHDDQLSNRGLMTEEQLQIAIADARAHGERIVMTNGCFDILHPGHVTYLEQAKALGNRLIIAVNDDNSVKRLKGNNRPINSLEKRAAVLAGLSAVDWVVSFSEDTPERIINLLSPDVLVKGGDYTVDKIAGAKAVLAKGGQVKILDFVDGCSTTALVERIREGTTT